ncbi:MAG: hypothetical protein O2904_04675 [bacterium]|nr:hypothetical protein [bacterium]
MKQGVIIGFAEKDEWKEWKAIRLLALKDAPDSFGELYEDAVQKSDKDWEQNLSDVVNSKDRAVFFSIKR